ncbi:uncharacterized mitochondrial protein AtMg00810-like [Pyrus x bretschneideri]|uniref:uncharacterized mitochondrial protein AtMg00810-like n=1 Tax=Pyrus x bretschneideri TaxID=225117 RepID=UPI00202F5EFB|nr:uncharacterized mitochondrial protein AtMg00810-like [Pyrus x bretschneideri]
MTVMTAMFAQNVAPYQIGEAWILDTGASHHMTSDVHNLNQVVPFEGFDKIKIGNGQGQDGIIITRSDASQVQHTIDQLGELFDLKDVGALTYFLGLYIQYRDNGTLFVNQTKYAKELLKKAGIDICKPASTSSKPHTQVCTTEGLPLEDPTFYRSFVGVLQYLRFTRPDISHVVNVVCQYMSHPTESHLFLVKRILRYIQGILHCGINFQPSPDTQLSAYSDSDWVANISTRLSQTSYVVFFGPNPISW